MNELTKDEAYMAELADFELNDVFFLNLMTLLLKARGCFYGFDPKHCGKTVRRKRKKKVK